MNIKHQANHVVAPTITAEEIDLSKVNKREILNSLNSCP